MVACVSMPASVYGRTIMKVINMDTIDAVTSNLSTFPHDHETMLHMINGTRTTKSMPVFYSIQMISIADLVAQRCMQA
jgi:hypothetical protein